MRIVALLLILACGPALAQEDLSGEPAPAGEYQLDPAHARLLFRVNHLGFSHYTALIQKFDAKIGFDPDNPETMTVRRPPIRLRSRPTIRMQASTSTASSRGRISWMPPPIPKRNSPRPP